MDNLLDLATVDINKARREIDNLSAENNKEVYIRTALLNTNTALEDIVTHIRSLEIDLKAKKLL